MQTSFNLCQCITVITDYYITLYVFKGDCESFKNKVAENMLKYKMINSKHTVQHHSVLHLLFFLYIYIYTHNADKQF